MKIISAKDIKKPTALRVIFGNPGMGKTSTVKYMPGKKLLIDLDGTIEERGLLAEYMQNGLEIREGI